MAEKAAAKSQNVYSCSSRVVGGSPCPMVLRDHCRNCSVRLNPPYSALFGSPSGFFDAQEPRGSSPMASGIDQPKPFQMEQLGAQSSVSH